jgi:hypothetical protein
VQHRNWNRNHGAHKHDGRGNRGDWRSRVHDHANGAMIGVRRNGMDVRYLDERNQRKQ